MLEPLLDRCSTRASLAALEARQNGERMRGERMRGERRTASVCRTRGNAVSRHRRLARDGQVLLWGVEPRAGLVVTVCGLTAPGVNELVLVRVSDPSL